METQNVHEVTCERTRSESLETPDEVKRALPLCAAGERFVAQTRDEIAAVLSGRDPRLLVIVGPCSIHDPAAALEYADRVVRFRARFGDDLLIAMRVYFEKARTAIGWKGLLNDPRLDGSCDLGAGLRLARALLTRLAALRVPAATETLDLIAPHYLGDAIAWTAIGARTSESQVHREVASSLPCPVGFKNGTDGDLAIAMHAMRAARAGHTFLGVDSGGRVAVMRSGGNPHTHLILRGGRRGPNYREPEVTEAAEQLAQQNLTARVLIDCSHDNSAKDHERQADVLREAARQVQAGSQHVLGVMLESHLRAGRQDLRPGCSLAYGQSITDACLGVEQTEVLLEQLASAARARRTRKGHVSVLPEGRHIGPGIEVG